MIPETSGKALYYRNATDDVDNDNNSRLFASSVGSIRFIATTTTMAIKIWTTAQLLLLKGVRLALRNALRKGGQKKGHLLVLMIVFAGNVIAHKIPSFHCTVHSPLDRLFNVYLLAVEGPSEVLSLLLLGSM